MQNITLTITQLNTYVKRIIDAEDLISNVSVFGEVSNFKISGNNAYFDIKEEGAQLSCVMFGAFGLNQKNGDKVLVTGRLNFFISTIESPVFKLFCRRYSVMPVRRYSFRVPPKNRLL